MSDLYITVGADPSGDSDSHFVTANQLGLGRLRESDTEPEDQDTGPDAEPGEWVLKAVSPATFSPVSFAADDLDDAKAQVIEWLDEHLRTERPDLLDLLGE